MMLSREEMLQRVSESNDVQFQWTMLSVDIDDDDLAQELYLSDASLREASWVLFCSLPSSMICLDLLSPCLPIFVDDTKINA